MKKYLLYLAVFFTACSSFNNETARNELLPESSTKANDALSYNLSDSDVQAYIHYLSVYDDTRDNAVIDVSPVLKNDRIVYYIINMEHGWRLLSADKRGPVILASDADGLFSLDKSNDEELSWLESIAGAIEYRWDEPDDYYSKIDENAKQSEALCVNFWKAITVDVDFLRECGLFQTKAHDPYPYILELHRVYETIDEYETVDHLISSAWKQNVPFNNYCPLVTDNGSLRCPAGCVAIAAAQVLRYLNSFMGVPVNSPASGSCVGSIQSGYTQSFTSYECYTWDGMQDETDSLGYASLLIGDVGKKVGMNYGATGSWASTTNLPYTVFASYGIDCSYSWYFDVDDTFASIQDGYPVICRANNSNTNGGHSFIVDGYISEVTTTHYEYSIIYLDPPAGVLLPAWLEETSLSNPRARSFKINWGLGAYGRTANYEANGSWLGYDLGRGTIMDYSEL